MNRLSISMNQLSAFYLNRLHISSRCLSSSLTSISKTCFSPNMAIITTKLAKSSTSASATNAVSATADRSSTKVLTVPEGINPALNRMEYAVRGAIVQRAEELSEQLRRQPLSLPFSQVIYCNIGNPQSVGQQPVTFLRQVLSVLVCPSLLSADPSPFPFDVIDRARSILSQSHGIGAYTESPGLSFIRDAVAEALCKRDDGIPASRDSIFLTNGASDGVKALLQLLIRSPNDGVMIPIPQYPLYSATLTALSGTQVPYYLDEDSGDQWTLHVEELQRSLDSAREKGVNVRAFVVINPGNPTGHLLSEEEVHNIVRFCESNQLLILADEVYQTNIYNSAKKFTSFKKAVVDLQSQVELASFHSVSKGVLGECGIRGGFVEIHNMEQETRNTLYKVMSVSLCSNVLGQAAVHVMMSPPVLEDPSYQLYTKEVGDILNSLKRKSRKLSDALNTFEGVTCKKSEGAMYLYPKVALPEKAVKQAGKQRIAPDDLYCMEMLEQTGICTVPGSGFGQRDGTFHFRTTFLPSEDQIDDVAEQMRRFHQNFLEKYS